MVLVVILLIVAVILAGGLYMYNRKPDLVLQSPPYTAASSVPTDPLPEFVYEDQPAVSPSVPTDQPVELPKSEPEVIHTPVFEPLNCSTLIGSGPAPSECLESWYKESGCPTRFTLPENQTIEATRAYILAKSQAIDAKGVQECHGMYKNPLGQALVSAIPGLVGQYTVDSWDGSVWNDISGKRNHAASRGTITVQGGELTGGQADGIVFPPSILPENFTLFYVAGYRGDDVSKHGRIFDSSAGNSLFGFYGKKAGVTHLGTWTTAQTGNGGRNMLGTHTNRVTRSNGVDISKIESTKNIPTGAIRLTINAGKYRETQSSVWGVGEVIVFDRKLPVEEMKVVEEYLRVKFNY